MRTSPAGRAFVGAHEGLRTRAYRDAVGVWTIGYGHTAAAGSPTPAAGMTITAAEAEAILARDLAVFERAVEGLAKVPLAQHEFDALVSFAFNLGAANLAGSTLLRKLNAGDRAGAAAEFGRWNKAGGRVLAGLTRRRAEERALFLGLAGAAGGTPAADGQAPAAAPDEAAAAPPPVPAATGTAIAQRMTQEDGMDERQTTGAAAGAGADGGGADGAGAAGAEAGGGAAMAKAKSALASRGVWGGLLAALAGAVPVFAAAFGLDAETQGEILKIVAGLGGVVGGALAIWGRVAATRRIG